MTYLFVGVPPHRQTEGDATIITVECFGGHQLSTRTHIYQVKFCSHVHAHTRTHTPTHIRHTHDTHTQLTHSSHIHTVAHDIYTYYQTM